MYHTRYFVQTHRNNIGTIISRSPESRVREVGFCYDFVVTVNQNNNCGSVPTGCRNVLKTPERNRLVWNWRSSSSIRTTATCEMLCSTRRRSSSWSGRAWYTGWSVNSEGEGGTESA